MSTEELGPRKLHRVDKDSIRGTICYSLPLAITMIEAQEQQLFVKMR